MKNKLEMSIPTLTRKPAGNPGIYSGEDARKFSCIILNNMLILE